MRWFLIPILILLNSCGRTPTCDFSKFCGRVGGLLTNGDLLLASTPQLNGSEPEANGGNSQNYRESPNDKLLVVFENIVRGSEKDFNARVKGGAIFWIIVIGGLLTVLWLYQAQR